MSLLTFLEWLENTPGSIGIRESILFYPYVETTHVLTLGLFLGMIALWDLRLVGWAFPRVPVSEVGDRLLPWALAGFVIMVISGGLLFYSGPVRAAGNIFFQIKMVMLVLAGVNALVFHKTTYRTVSEWAHETSTPRRARVAGFFSLVLWAGVVVCGRMQAYNWFD